MTRTLFRTTRFDLYYLVTNIRRGDVALPDIQRPFVWPNRKVRDLLDSMLKGFPVGYLLFWSTDTAVGSRNIGTDDKEVRVARWVIVDGQQRLTSLYSVLTGQAVVREDYTRSRIRIGFNPLERRFEVTDAAILNDPEFIADITPLFDSFWETRESYLGRLEQARGPLNNDLKHRIEEQLDRVRDLRSYPFDVVELDAAVEEEDVAEVFVRINSEGVTLSQADFILTLMSVFRDRARLQLEEFARAAKTPSTDGPSPFNWYIQPQPDQLLRVGVAVAFRRAVLKNVYSILRGKDLATGELSTVCREEQFDRLQVAQDHLLNLLHWHEFLLCLERAGFRGSKMISSENAILFCYALWLIGRVEYQVPLDRLKEVMARWFFMAHTTSRYSGSFESRFEADVARFASLSPGDAEGFISILDQVIDDTMTPDYWSITLPNDLATSAARSPALLAYIAALNIHDADMLLSTSKVRSRLDPAVTLQKGIERHHLFPKAYLKDELGITTTSQVNQIANFALVDWSDNIVISDSPPHQYWPELTAQKDLAGNQLARAMYWHALFEGWEQMPYDDFLRERRVRMAIVVRDAMALLKDVSYRPRYPATNSGADADPGPSSDAELRPLVDANLLSPGTMILAGDGNDLHLARVRRDGRIDAAGSTYDSLLDLSESLHLQGDPWRTWSADLADGMVQLATLRETHDSNDVAENEQPSRNTSSD